jgi:hypothetical protein
MASSERVVHTLQPATELRTSLLNPTSVKITWKHASQESGFDHRELVKVRSTSFCLLQFDPALQFWQEVAISKLPYKQPYTQLYKQLYKQGPSARFVQGCVVATPACVSTRFV